VCVCACFALTIACFCAHHAHAHTLPAAAGPAAALIRCLPESPCERFFFQDVRIEAVGGYKCDPPGLVKNSSFVNCHPLPACIVDV